MFSEAFPDESLQEENMIRGKSMQSRFFILFCGMSHLLLCMPTFAQVSDPLARDVKTILEQRCGDCHAQGSAEGGIDFILNRGRLVQRKFIVPGDSINSTLYKQVKTGAMPKDAEPLSKMEIDKIKRWIDSGAIDWSPRVSRKAISPTDILYFISNDLDVIEKENPQDLPFIRYFTITHLYNVNNFSDDELETYRRALSKLVNSLSWGSDIVIPQPIDPVRTILRIDLRDYRWTPETWNHILAENPYGVIYDSDKAKSCYARTRSLLPYVRADWFVAKASIPPLYHDILDIPLTDVELEQRLKINVQKNLSANQVARAGFNGSGVSNNNRLIERHFSDLTQGAYWKSYDFKPLREKQAGAGLQDFPERNLFDRPLGPKVVMPDVSNPFQHAGGELIWNLPNGLQAYMLIDDSGKRIDVGPTDIVSDPGRPDRAVINGLSCMSCHARGMKDKKDQIRDAVLENRSAYTAIEVKLVEASYPSHEQFQAFLDQDRERFTKAVERTGSKVSDTDPVVVLAQRFDSEVDLILAAAEIGISSEQLHKGIESLPESLRRAIGPLRTQEGTVKRDLFVSLFGTVIHELNLGPKEQAKWLSKIDPPT
ncbi:MAG: c-type cytochrome domain-containing protein, partial [Planctomycetaceae bacterium]